MASIKVILRKDKQNKEGKYPVSIRLIHNRKKKYISLKQYLNDDEWDTVAGLAIEKSRDKEHKIYLQRLNLSIVSRREEIKQRILELDEKGRPYTIDMILNLYKTHTSVVTFFEYMRSLIERMESLGQYGNARIYEQTLSIFKTFRNEKDLYFEEFSYKVVIDFEEYLLKKGNKVNTVYTYMRKLKAAYNKAINEGIVKEEYYPFKKYKIKTEKTVKRAITKENLHSIKELDLSREQTLLAARNIFLFSFYTRGISFVDIANLKVKNIVGDRLSYTRNKTNQKFSIKLTEPMLEIINQYNGLENPESYLFPIIKEEEEDNNRKYLNALRLTNKKLKEIGKRVNLPFPLTTYVARHSWATIAKRAGIPTAIISEGLGHETEKTTQIYLDSFENDVLDEANDLITKI